MRFTSPLALFLLLVLPAIAIMGWPRRGFGWRREVVSLGLRLLIALSLILALAGLEIVRAADQLAVVFLVDASDSMPASAQSFASDYMRQALAEMRPDDQAALIVFGGDALVERPMSSSNEMGAITSIPRTNQTDLAEAIRLGLALYPPDTSRRMVILSDGNATTGDALQAAQLAAASGVQILAVPVEQDTGPEALVAAVDAPSHLHQGEQFDLKLVVDATRPTQAGVQVIAAGEVVYQGSHALKQGTQSFSLPLTAGEPGFTRYQVQIDPEEDGYYQNNELAAYALVEGPPRILLAAPQAGEPMAAGERRPDEAAQVLNALRSTGFDVRTVSPGEMPSELLDLASYASLVLVDVPARDLSQRQMLAIQSYVRDLGGGLISIGGPTSYGVGGYFQTPIEETLPVEMQIKDEQRRPSLTIVFIIDHSGSMSETSGGVTKLDLAKEAAIRSVEMMFPTDRVGVIAFDESASWVVPITGLNNSGQVKNAIGSIQSGGGTDILAGVQAMAGALPQDPVNLKHVILLTDGGADPAGIPELVEQLHREHGITLTTVGVGQDAAPFLPQLAESGGGRYHYTIDPSTIPRIFTEETSLATRAYIVERAFFPEQVNPSPILTGLHEAPQLYGYVGTSIKDVAQSILVSDLGDPILASWQYGLGRAVAFTSDATGRWAKDWISWQGFPTFWGQAVNFTLRNPAASSLAIRVEHQDEIARLIVDAQDENGGYLNDYNLQANIVDPDGAVVSILLRQVAPGYYQAAFTPTRQGAYLIGVAGGPEKEAAPAAGQVDILSTEVIETAGWVLSYSPEYRDATPNPQELERLAGLTGGYLAGSDPGLIFQHNFPAGRVSRPVWPWLLVLCAVLLPLDIAVRRLVVPASEIRLAVKRWTARVEGAPEARPAQPARSTGMDALLQAKQRAAEMKIKKPPANRDPRSSSQEATSMPGHPAQPDEAPSGGEGQTSKQSKESTGSTVGDLLEAKRGRRKND